jgi:hypothetical protein
MLRTLFGFKMLGILVALALIALQTVPCGPGARWSVIGGQGQTCAQNAACTTNSTYTCTGTCCPGMCKINLCVQKKSGGKVCNIPDPNNSACPDGCGVIASCCCQ